MGTSGMRTPGTGSSRHLSRERGKKKLKGGKVSHATPRHCTFVLCLCVMQPLYVVAWLSIEIQYTYSITMLMAW